VDIVIVADGTHHGLRRCLESLKAHLPSSPHDVMVVDNDRDPQTETLVKSVQPLQP
jgi:hypothetical protein